MPFLTHPFSHISGLKISTRSKLAWGLSLESWRTCIVKISKSTLSHFSFLHVLHSFILIISLLLDFPHLSVTKLFTGNFDFIWAIHPTCDVKLLFLLSYFTLFSDLYLLSHHSPCVSSLCSIIPFLTFPTPIFTPSTWLWYFLFLTSLWCFFSLFFFLNSFSHLGCSWFDAPQARLEEKWTEQVRCWETITTGCIWQRELTRSSITVPWTVCMFVHVCASVFAGIMVALEIEVNLWSCKLPR